MDDKLLFAASKCLVNYGFFISATAENLEDLPSPRPACGIKISTQTELITHLALPIPSPNYRS